MKILVVMVLCAMAGTAGAQSLKEALYGGRLKNDTGAVLKKTDTLKLRENMAQKAKDDSVKKETAVKEKEMKAADPAPAAEINAATPPAAATETPAEGAASATAPAVPLTAKDNNRVWKEFIDRLSAEIRSEVLTSKKMKAGTYSVLVDYEIGLDGQVAVVGISSDPSNSFLEGQIKERITLGAPQLAPALLANGKPRKSMKKQLLVFTK